MSVLIFKCIEITISFLECYFAYEYTGIIAEKKMPNRIKVLYSLCLTGIIHFCNDIALFSVFTLFFAVLFISTTTNIYSKTMELKYLFYSYLYYLCVYIFDFATATLLGIMLHDPDFVSEVAKSVSQKRCLFLLLSKLFLFSAILLAKRYEKYLDRLNSKNVMGIVLIGSLLGTFTTLFTFKQVTPELFFSWLMLLFIIILLYFSSAIYNKYLQECTNQQIVRIRNELVNQKYTELLENFQANAEYFHDSTNHLAIISNLISREKYADVKKYIGTLLKEIQTADITWTGNDIIDYIINQKKEYAEAAGIRFILVSDPLYESRVGAEVFSVVFSNLLDNAIEACCNMTSLEKWIKVSVRQIHFMLVVKIENSMEKMPIRDENGLNTLKEDKKLHGWGMKSVISAVDKAQGEIEYHYNERTFNVTVTFF